MTTVTKVAQLFENIGQMVNQPDMSRHFEDIMYCSSPLVGAGLLDMLH